MSRHDCFRDCGNQCDGNDHQMDHYALGECSFGNHGNQCNGNDHQMNHYILGECSFGSLRSKASILNCSNELILNQQLVSQLL